MMTGGDCELTNAFKFFVGDKEGVEGILEHIDGKPLGGGIIVGQVQQVQGDRFCQNV